MKILTRYVIRAHIGPFFFAFTALTGLIFLNAVAQRLDRLAGRGLGLEVYGEFLLLSLPHVIALTFPMSILVATLYAFSDLTGNNEVAAMSAGGVHPLRLILPLAGLGVLLAGGVFFFNNQVLPEANRRLSSLLTDISSKSPTLQLREQVFNEIPAGDQGRFFLRAGSIDSRTQELTDVSIYDLTEPGVSRNIVAASGRMQTSADQTDLTLTLSNGTLYEVSENRRGAFQRLEYDTHILPMRDVFQAELQRQAGGGASDREMTIAMLRTEVAGEIEELRRVAEESRMHSMDAVRIALGDAATTAPPPTPPDPGPEAGQSGGPLPSAGASGPRILPGSLTNDVTGIYRVNQSRWEIFRLEAYRYLVEIHKKYAIAVACIIFLLLGPPLAMRFPQGGVGLVMAASVIIFFLYWVGLIGGEELADRGAVPPAVAMWTPNAILVAWAGLLLWSIEHRISTNRGSAWSAFAGRIRRLFRRDPLGGQRGA